MGLSNHIVRWALMAIDLMTSNLSEIYVNHWFIKVFPPHELDSKGTGKSTTHLKSIIKDFFQDTSKLKIIIETVVSNFYLTFFSLIISLSTYDTLVAIN